MPQSTNSYFLNSKKILLSIGIAFFLTSCIELFILFLSSVLLRKPMAVYTPAYLIQSMLVLSGLWLSFRFLKNAPIYLIALSVATFHTTMSSLFFFIMLPASIQSFLLTNFVSVFVLIFIWMHLTQNLENKPRALKIGYFTYFIAIECLGLIPSSIRGENHIIFLVLALIGYKISSVIFELGIKISFKVLKISAQ